MRKISILLILAVLVSLLTGCELKIPGLPFLGGEETQPEASISEPTEQTMPPMTGISPVPPEVPDVTRQVTVATTPPTDPTRPPIPEEELNWKPFQAYRRVVDQLRVAEGSNWSACSYVLYDMDDDGHPELITRRGTTMADTYFEVYTMVGENAVYVGIIGDSLLGGLSTEPGLLSIWGRQGMEEITVYTLQGTTLQAELIYSDYGKEYHDCQELVRYGLTDQAGWNWESNPWDNNAALVEQLRKPKPASTGYVIRVGNSEQQIHKEANGFSDVVMYLPAGKYTIVEEFFDGYVLWGKLKSGAGWVCLDDILGYAAGYSPIIITEAVGSGNYDRYDIRLNEYSRGILVHFRQTVDNLILCDATGGMVQAELLQLTGPLDPGDHVAFYVDFPGDLSEYQIRVQDSQGHWYAYFVYTSGYDGSIRSYE